MFPAEMVPLRSVRGRRQGPPAEGGALPPALPLEDLRESDGGGAVVTLEARPEGEVAAVYRKGRGVRPSGGHVLDSLVRPDYERLVGNLGPALLWVLGDLDGLRQGGHPPKAE